jgi:hypothetical protein
MIARLGTDLTAAFDTGAQCVGPCDALRVQARLTGYSGELTILQGESPTAMTPTKTSGALTATTGSAEYYDLRPSEWVQITGTLTAGTVNELLVAYTEAGRW